MIPITVILSKNGKIGLSNKQIIRALLVSLTVLSGTKGKKQVDEPWFNLLLHETKFLGEKGLVGRNSVMFALSLAETCEYNMFEFNNRLDQPLEEKEVIKIVRSAYSENYQGANREYITILCKAWVSSDLTSKDLFVRQGWFKFKKKEANVNVFICQNGKKI